MKELALEKHLVKKHFNRQAHQYDQYSLIQKMIADRLMRLLNHDINPSKILDIGCGTGYLTEKLQRRFPTSTIVALDIAPGMLAVAKGKLAKSARIKWVEADIELISLAELTQEGFFDLIVSSTAFQWLINPKKTLIKLSQAMTSNGVLAFATLGNDTFKELHHAFEQAKIETEGVYRHGLTLPTYHWWCELINSLFSDTRNDRESIQALYPSTISFLKSVKGIGANNAVGEGAICRKPRVIKKMIQIYEESFRLEDQVYATYEALYFYGKSMTNK